MWHRNFFISAGFGCLLLAWVTGCGPAASERKAANSSAAQSPVVHWEWIGSTALAARAQATNLMAIGRLPETRRLEARALDKLALAPWRLWKSDAATNRAPHSLLRGLLADLLAEESQFTLWAESNAPSQLRLAVRMPAARAGIWHSNLAAVAESLCGGAVSARPTGWEIAWPAGLAGFTGSNQVLRLARDQDWTVVTLAAAGAEVSRFNAPQTPGTVWQTEANLAWLLPRLGAAWQPPAGWPQMTWRATLEGGEIKSRGELNFAQALPLTFPAWQVPTNLIRDPLMSFVAVRGVEQALLGETWNTVFPGPAAPNQIFGWSALGLPHLSFVTFPQAKAAEWVRATSERLRQGGNQWLAQHAMGEFKSAPQGDGIVWADCAFLGAFLRSTEETSGPYVLAGLFPDGPSQNLFPEGLASALHSTTNLVGYGWEMTGERLDSLLYLSQLFRVIFNKAQLPPQSVGIPWLKQVIPLLGNCVTRVDQSRPEQLTVTRSSTTGFSALEIQLLVDWVESPEFPVGLHSLRAVSDLPRPGP